jgi:sulfite reductase (NADPH) flavoprotein alpha-component
MTALALKGLDPMSSPLDAPQLQALNDALTGLSPAQLAWVSGYLAGLGGLALPAAANAPEARPTLSVLYGSQTGNARRVAESLSAQAMARGLAVRMVSMGDYKPRQLARERFVLIVISTHGEGEPPESARDFHAFVHGKRAPALGELRYAVLGLGDSSYEHFCRTAQELDQRLSELGAQRVLPSECCDVDFAGPADAWTGRALDIMVEQLPAKRAEVVALPGVHLVRANRHDRDNPYRAALLDQRRLTTDDAVSDVRHLAFAADPQQLRYTPGDALGVWFRNDPALVEQVLGTTGVDADAAVTVDGTELRLADALLERLELTQLHPRMVQAWSQLTRDSRLQDLVADKALLRAYAAAHQPMDLLADFPARPQPADMAAALQPLQPRLYSIASSQAECPDEVHLTVAVVRFHARGRDHLGGASGFLAERLGVDATASVYLVENPAFRLPEDGETPVIMVGAGTGIAPYRAFLQQRAADGATGRNWLVFGNRNFRRDFLYQLDWQAWRKAGLVHRVSLAFSRDRAERVYVQQRLCAQAAELYRWLAEGAHLYVCGSTAMGQAVHQALLEVAAGGGGLDEEAASTFVDGLRGAGRYHRDLY